MGNKQIVLRKIKVVELTLVGEDAEGNQYHINPNNILYNKVGLNYIFIDGIFKVEKLMMLDQFKILDLKNQYQRDIQSSGFKGTFDEWLHKLREQQEKDNKKPEPEVKPKSKDEQTKKIK